MKFNLSEGSTNVTYEFPDGSIKKWTGSDWEVIGWAKDTMPDDIPLRDLVTMDAAMEDPEEIKNRIQQTDEYANNPVNQKQFRNDQKQIKSKALAAKAKDELRKQQEDAMGQEHGQSQFSMDFQAFMKRKYGVKMQEEPSRAKIARNYMSTDVLAPGTREFEKENEKPPLITIYVDYSGSIGDKGRKAAERILRSIKNYEQKGVIKTKIKYFTNEVFDTREAVKGSGTNGKAVLEDIKESIKKDNLENVIIMTDSGFSSSDFNGTVILPGCAWLFFLHGDRDEDLVHQIRGNMSPYQVCYSWDFSEEDS